MTRWYVCDMDDGVLRVEPTRAAALAWWMRHQDAPKVLWRHRYTPGYYAYMVGHSAEDSAGDVAIVREDKLAAYGITERPDGIRPLHPKGAL